MTPEHSVSDRAILLTMVVIASLLFLCFGNTVDTHVASLGTGHAGRDDRPAPGGRVEINLRENTGLTLQPSAMPSTSPPRGLDTPMAVDHRNGQRS